jgi:hypothetical protein
MLTCKPAIHILIFCAIISVSVCAQGRWEIKQPLSMRTLAFQTATPSVAEEGVDTDNQSAKVYRTTVRNLFDQEKFAELEQTAAAARTGKSRFPGGGWKLYAFYGAIKTPGSQTDTEAQWAAHIERLQRWIAFRPDSSTPRVALAAGYLSYAWKARGSAYANRVPEEDMKLFWERAQRARETLVQARSLANKDPQWYLEMQSVARALEWKKKQEEQLLEEAFQFEPTYYYFYENHVENLLPKWGGQPGDPETFAKTIADRVGGPEGDVIYFNVAMHLNCCKAQPQAPFISWDRVKKGFQALDQLYGSTNHQRNELAFVAFRQGDGEYARQIFARINDNWDKAVWLHKVRFDTARAALGNTP